MAIELTFPKDDEMDAHIDNGHLVALRKIATDYNLKSEKEALSFLLAIISQANGLPIEINGSKYLPSDSLKKEQPK
ncbi:MAG: hypothetical protein AAB384_00125 [Patescibacteria group bacterium]